MMIELQCQEVGCRNRGNCFIIRGDGRKDSMIPKDIGFCDSVHLERWIHRYNSGTFIMSNSIEPKTMKTKREAR